MDLIFVEMSKAGNFNGGIYFTMSRSPEALRACCDDKQAGKRAGSSSMDSIFVQMGSGRRYFHGSATTSLSEFVRSRASPLSFVESICFV